MPGLALQKSSSASTSAASAVRSRPAASSAPDRQWYTNNAWTFISAVQPDGGSGDTPPGRRKEASETRFPMLSGTEVRPEAVRLVSEARLPMLSGTEARPEGVRLVSEAAGEPELERDDSAPFPHGEFTLPTQLTGCTRTCEKSTF